MNRRMHGRASLCSAQIGGKTVKDEIAQKQFKSESNKPILLQLSRAIIQHPAEDSSKEAAVRSSNSHSEAGSEAAAQFRDGRPLQWNHARWMPHWHVGFCLHRGIQDQVCVHSVFHRAHEVDTGAWRQAYVSIGAYLCLRAVSG